MDRTYSVTTKQLLHRDIHAVVWSNKGRMLSVCVHEAVDLVNLEQLLQEAGYTRRDTE